LNVLTNLNLNNNEIQNFVVQVLAVAPSNPKKGRMYFDSVTNSLKQWDGTAWNEVGKEQIFWCEVGTTTFSQVTAALSANKFPIAIDAQGTNTVFYYIFAGQLDNNNYCFTSAVTVMGVSGIMFQTLTNEDTWTAAYAAIPTEDGIEEAINGAVANYLPLAGGTMTGALLLNGAPTANLHAATKKYVDDAVGALATITITVVQTLPATGQSNVVYLVPKSTAQTSNVYDEYIWVASTNKFEKVGDTEIDLSNYLQTTGNASSTTVAFTAAASRALPATGESLATIIGKVVKYFTDLKTVAFSGSYNDLSNKPALPFVNTATMSTSETTKSITASGTAVVNVQIVDSVTHEVVVADVTINGKAVTVTVAAAPTNALTITVLSI
jgi:hypothetical protein